MFMPLGQKPYVFFCADFRKLGWGGDNNQPCLWLRGMIFTCTWYKNLYSLHSTSRGWTHIYMDKTHIINIAVCIVCMGNTLSACQVPTGTATFTAPSTWTFTSTTVTSTTVRAAQDCREVWRRFMAQIYSNLLCEKNTIFTYLWIDVCVPRASTFFCGDWLLLGEPSLRFVYTVAIAVFKFS